VDDQLPSNQNADFKGKTLYKTGGLAALIAGGLFLIAVIDLAITVLRPGTIIDWLSPFHNNWLIVIFKLHAGFSGVQLDLLHVLNYLDVAILVFVGITILGLYTILKSSSRIWSFIALIQPFLGVLLFIATKNAGRSSVMGAVLVISIVMLRNNIFHRAVAYMGILAGVLLLTGDFSAGIIPPFIIVAALFGSGYVLLMAWFFLVARRLFQFGRPG